MPSELPIFAADKRWLPADVDVLVLVEGLISAFAGWYWGHPAIRLLVVYLSRTNKQLSGGAQESRINCICYID